MIKFLTQPKTFHCVDGTSFTIEAISVSVPECSISMAPTIPLQFHFFTKEVITNEDESTTEVFTKHSDVLKPNVYKNVSIPNVGDIDFIAGLFSYDKTKVYQVATLFALQSGYTLLPLLDQQDLNQI